MMILEKISHDIDQYPFEGSLCGQVSRPHTLNEIPPETQRRLLAAELSFLYSTQYFAEANGEAGLEGMKSMTYQPAKQNRILDCQMRDELEHTALLKTIVERLGIDQQSNCFATGYVHILNSVETLAEKIFVFQVMTEAVSAAYLQWRIRKINIAEFNSIDQQIYLDELRHLKMGHSLLGMCDPHEIRGHRLFNPALKFAAEFDEYPELFDEYGYDVLINSNLSKKVFTPWVRALREQSGALSGIHKKIKAQFIESYSTLAELGEQGRAQYVVIVAKKRITRG